MIGLIIRAERKTDEDMYRFDLCTKQWEYLVTSGDCPCGRYRHQAMVKDDLMYIVGGSGINRYGDVWTFHFGTNVWRRVLCSGTDLSDGRYAHSAVLRDGFIYLYGGNDTETKIWSRVLVHGKDCPPGRDFHAAVLRKDSLATTITWDSIYMSVSYFQQFLGKQVLSVLSLCFSLPLFLAMLGCLCLKRQLPVHLMALLVRLCIAYMLGFSLLILLAGFCDIDMPVYLLCSLVGLCGISSGLMQSMVASVSGLFSQFSLQCGASGAALKGTGGAILWCAVGQVFSLTLTTFLLALSPHVPPCESTESAIFWERYLATVLVATHTVANFLGRITVSGQWSIIVAYGLMSFTGGLAAMLLSQKAQSLCGHDHRIPCPIVSQITWIAIQLGGLIGVAFSCIKVI
eukprot:g7928.t1